jgi:hypothetical protein
MRRLFLVLPIVFILNAVVRADEVTDLRDRALKAFAKDPTDIKKMRVHTLKAKGTMKIGNEPMPATFEQSAVWPGQVRFFWEWGTGAAKNSVTIAGANDGGWRRIGTGPAMDMSIEEKNDLRADAYAMWVATLSTLSDTDTKLAVATPIKINGDPAFGLKVTRRSFPDVTLYFDEKSGLLRKTTYRSREAGVTLNKELTYDGHKPTKGLMLPTKETIVIQGKEAFLWGELEYEFPEKIDAKVFEMPK